MKIVLATLLLVGLASAIPQLQTQEKPHKLAKVIKALNNPEVMAKIQAQLEAVARISEAVKALTRSKFVAKVQAGKEGAKALDIPHSAELKFLCDIPFVGMIC